MNLLVMTISMELLLLHVILYKYKKRQDVLLSRLTRQRHTKTGLAQLLSILAGRF
jgi:hypothetical protein